MESYARLGVRVSPGFTISLFMEGLYLFYIIFFGLKAFSNKLFNYSINTPPACESRRIASLAQLVRAVVTLWDCVSRRFDSCTRHSNEYVISFLVFKFLMVQEGSEVVNSASSRLF